MGSPPLSDFSQMISPAMPRVDSPRNSNHLVSLTLPSHNSGNVSKRTARSSVPRLDSMNFDAIAPDAHRHIMDTTEENSHRERSDVEQEDTLKTHIARLLPRSRTKESNQSVRIAVEKARPLWVSHAPPRTLASSDVGVKERKLDGKREDTLVELKKVWENAKELLEKEVQQVYRRTRKNGMIYCPSTYNKAEVEQSLETLLGSVGTSQNGSTNRVSAVVLPARMERVSWSPAAVTAMESSNVPIDVCRKSSSVRVPTISISPSMGGSGDPASNARIIQRVSGDPTSNARIIQRVSGDPTSNIRIIQRVSGDPATNSRIIQQASGDPATNARIIQQASGDPTSNAQIIQQASGDPASNSRIIQRSRRGETKRRRRMANVTLLPGVFMSLPESLIMADCCIAPGTNNVYVSALHKGIYIMSQGYGNGKLKSSDHNEAGDFCISHRTSKGGSLIYATFSRGTSTWWLNVLKYQGQPQHVQWETTRLEISPKTGQLISACIVGKNSMVAIAQNTLGEYSLLSIEGLKDLALKVKATVNMSTGICKGRNYGNPNQVVSDSSHKQLFVLTETHLMRVRGFFGKAQKVKIVWAQRLGAPNRLSMIDNKLYVTQSYSSRGLLFTPDGQCTGEVAVEGHAEDSAQTDGRGDSGASSPLIALKVVQNKEGKPVVVCYRRFMSK